MKSRTIYIVLGAAFILVLLAILSVFGTKNTTTTNPVATATVATSTTASTTSSGLQVYQNEQFGFQFEWNKNEILSDQLVIVFFSGSLNDKSPRIILGITSDVARLKNEIDDMTFSERWKPIKEISAMPYGTVTKKTWITNPNINDDRSCAWYLEDPKRKYIVTMQCKNISTLNQITAMFGELPESALSQDFQTYTNKKFGLEFHWNKNDPLSQRETLSIDAKDGEYQTYGLVHVDSDIESIKKSSQELADGPIKATKKDFEKPYGTVTSIEGVYGRDGDTFCDWYIKNPKKDYVVIIGCERTSILESLTFF